MIDAKQIYSGIKDFFTDVKTKKVLNIAIPVIFLIISIFITVSLRSTSATLPITDLWAEDTIYNQILSSARQQVASTSPFLPDSEKERLAQEKARKYMADNIDEINVQKQKYSKEIKGNLQADNGQTYLTAIDPYYYYGLANNYYFNGHTGDYLKVDDDGVERPFVYRRMSPGGWYGTYAPDLHVRLISFMFGLNNIDKNSSIGEKIKAMFFIPVIISALAILCLFLLVRKFTNSFYAFVASISLTTVSTFLSRTMAGFVDTDSYNVLFPILIVMFVIFGLVEKKIWKSMIYFILAGISQLLFLMIWGEGWFVFLFVLLAVFIDIIFKIVIYALKRDSHIIKKSRDEFIKLGGLFFFVFVFSLFKVNILTKIIKGIGGSTQFTSITSDIWPNVLSSVAELNPASFDQILNTVGGPFIFTIAMLGLVLISLGVDKDDHKKIKKYWNYIIVGSLIWFSCFTIKKGIFGLVGNKLIKLTNTQPLVFLILLFLPIALVYLYRLFFERNLLKEDFLVFIVSIWMAGTIYMSLYGVRFILFLAPAFAISFGLGFFSIANYLRYILLKLGIKESKPKTGIVYFVMLVLFIFIVTPMYVQARAISEQTIPNFDDAWYESMDVIKANSNETAIITSWWDFGHFFSWIGERGSTFDGGSQTLPQAHWVGRLLLENNESISNDILKMIVCGGNSAFDELLSISNDSTGGILVNKVIYSTFGKTRSEKETILKKNNYFNLSDSEVDSVMEKLYCKEPVEDFLITSGDMVSKAPVWAHWGSWDFTKKYVLENYNVLSAEDIAKNIDENVTTIRNYISELNKIEIEAKSRNLKRMDLVNRWLAPYPGFVQIQGRYLFSCNNVENKLTCQNGFNIDLSTKKVKTNQKQVVVKNLVILTNNGTEIFEQEADGNIDVTIANIGGTYVSLLSTSPLGGSLFTRLYYFNGLGVSNYGLLHSARSILGNDIKIWNVSWN